MVAFGKLFTADFWDEDQALAKFIFKALDDAAISEGMERPSVEIRREDDITPVWREL
jgi:hypothetical protein